MVEQIEKVEGEDILLPPNEQLNLTLYPGARLRKAQVNAVLGGR